jgi:cell division protein FtsW
VLAFDTTLVMSWLLLMGFGLVMVTSASIAMGDNFLTRHAIYVVAGLAAFAVAFAVPLRVWQASYRFAWLAAVVLCVLVLIPGIGHEVNGAKRWIDLGPVTFQASEAARFLFVVYMAGYLARFHEQLRDDVMILIRPLLAVAVIAVLLLREPDFGSVVVLGASACGLLFLAGARLRHFLGAGALSVGVLAVILFWEPYRVERLFSFTDPWASAFGSGYQLTQALIAFGRSGDFGQIGVVRPVFEVLTESTPSVVKWARAELIAVSPTERAAPVRCEHVNRVENVDERSLNSGAGERETSPLSLLGDE